MFKKFIKFFAFAGSTIILSLIVLSSLCQAADSPLRWGPEFTFTKHGLWPKGANEDESVFYREDSPIWKVQKDFLDSLVKRAEKQFGRKVEVTESLDRWNERKFLVKVPDTPLAITVSIDPDVVEIQMLPLTKDEFIRYRGQLQDIIWESARDNGLYTTRASGGGHINVSGGGTTTNPLLLRNLLVAFYNDHDLFCHYFGWPQEAVEEASGYRYPYSLTKTREARFLDVIHRFDAGRIRTYESLIRALGSVNYKPTSKWFHESRYSTWNFLHLRASVAEDHRRIEARWPAAQRSMDHFLRDVAFIEALITVASQNTLIPIEQRTLPERPDYRRMQKRLAFWETIAQMQWERYYPVYRKKEIEREKKTGCAKLLSKMAA